jgi:hypothetical protein
MKLSTAIEEQKKIMKNYRVNMYSLLFSLENTNDFQEKLFLDERKRVAEYLQLLNQAEAIIINYPEFNIEIENLTEFMIRCFLEQIFNLQQEPIRELLKKII